MFTDKNYRYVSKGSENIYKSECLHPFREFVSRSHYVKCAGGWNLIDDCESSILNFLNEMYNHLVVNFLNTIYERTEVIM